MMPFDGILPSASPSHSHRSARFLRQPYMPRNVFLSASLSVHVAATTLEISAQAGRAPAI